jgi:UDP:flavonoid glycosyltransferase YjiC (YdhE family)
MHGLTDAYRRERSTLGLPALPAGVTAFDHMISDQLHLQASTPSLEFPRRQWPASVRLVGPLLPPAPPTGSVPLPEWWPELQEADAVVHVTQGSIATDPTLLTRPALEGLAELDALVVVTTPDPDRLGPLPANTRLSGFVPHGLLLPEVDVVVTNAGYNGVKAALAVGVPLVMAPWGNDQPDVAARVTRVGAGIDLHRPTPAPHEIADAVQHALVDPGLRRAAGRLRTEFAQYPGGDHAATALADHIGAGSPIRTHPGGSPSR